MKERKQESRMSMDCRVAGDETETENAIKRRGKKKSTYPKGGGRGVRGSVGLVSLLLSLVPRGSDGSVVDPALSAVNHLAGRVVALVGSLLGRELDVTDTSRSTGLSVHLNSGRGDLTAVGELGSEPVLVNVPREVSNPEGGSGGVALTRPGGGLVGLSGLGLLSDGLGLLGSLSLG